MLTSQMMKDFNHHINESIQIKKDLYLYERTINKIIKKIYSTLKSKKKIYICGNGGSAADAQHIAAEYTVRLKINNNRRPLPFIALPSDSAYLTACGNDFGFEKIYVRALEALYSKNDLLIVLSTSGNSKNLIEAVKFAKKNNIFSIGFLGNTGGKLKSLCSTSLIINSKNTARIQETHMFLGHYICEKVEDLIFKSK